MATSQDDITAWLRRVSWVCQIPGQTERVAAFEDVSKEADGYTGDDWDAVKAGVMEMIECGKKIENVDDKCPPGSLEAAIENCIRQWGDLKAAANKVEVDAYKATCSSIVKAVDKSLAHHVGNAARILMVKVATSADEPSLTALGSITPQAIDFGGIDKDEINGVITASSTKDAEKESPKGESPTGEADSAAGTAKTSKAGSASGDATVSGGGGESVEDMKEAIKKADEKIDRLTDKLATKTALLSKAKQQVIVARMTVVAKKSALAESKKQIATLELEVRKAKGEEVTPEEEEKAQQDINDDDTPEQSPVVSDEEEEDVEDLKTNLPITEAVNDDSKDIPEPSESGRYVYRKKTHPDVENSVKPMSSSEMMRKMQFAKWKLVEEIDSSRKLREIAEKDQRRMYAEMMRIEEKLRGEEAVRIRLTRELRDESSQRTALELKLADVTKDVDEQKRLSAMRRAKHDLRSTKPNSHLKDVLKLKEEIKSKTEEIIQVKAIQTKLETELAMKKRESQSVMKLMQRQSASPTSSTFTYYSISIVEDDLARHSNNIDGAIARCLKVREVALDVSSDPAITHIPSVSALCDRVNTLQSELETASDGLHSTLAKLRHKKTQLSSTNGEVDLRLLTPSPVAAASVLNPRSWLDKDVRWGRGGSTSPGDRNYLSVEEGLPPPGQSPLPKTPNSYQLAGTPPGAGSSGDDTGVGSTPPLNGNLGDASPHLKRRATGGSRSSKRGYSVNMDMLADVDVDSISWGGVGIRKSLP
eukprot:GFYU01039696.1.p1 GENE.GFYU01039696.1~~GFYU01039696.1.p1  ORF type:complete len:761 (-),score=164.29 GFYU01039696.1:152-2434(-)